VATRRTRGLPEVPHRLESLASPLEVHFSNNTARSLRLDHARVSYPMVRTEGPIYEYACHEGTYGLMNILSGVRWEEKAADEARRKRK
jgi:hypothetical protein